MILLLASIGGVLFALDQSGWFSLQPGLIGILGKIPGWQDLPDAVADGRNEAKSWEQKENLYKVQIEQLRQEKEKVQKDLEESLFKKDSITKSDGSSRAGDTAKDKAPASVAPSASQAAILLADMKAPTAAEILLKVPSDVALEILQKMDNRKAAKIMEAMPVENGSDLLARLAQNQTAKTGK